MSGEVKTADLASPLQAVRGDGPSSPKSEDTQRAAEQTVLADEHLAAALVHDQHGPSYWRKLTDAGRDMYVKRFSEAVRRANEARAEAATPDAPLPAAPEAGE